MTVGSCSGTQRGAGSTSQYSVSWFSASVSKITSRAEVLVSRLVFGDGRDARGGRGRACIHKVCSHAEAAYADSDLLERRRDAREA